MKLQIGMDSMLKLLREFIIQTGFAVCGPAIDSKEWIPPAYVAWRAGTITQFLLGS